MQNIYFSSFVFRNFAKNGKANFNNRNRKKTVCQRRNGSYHRQGNRLGVSQTNRGHKNDNDRPPLRQNFRTTDYETGKKQCQHSILRRDTHASIHDNGPGL